MTLPRLKAPIPTSLLTLLTNWITNLFASQRWNPNNNVSVNSNVATLNATSGYVSFNYVVPDNTLRYLTMNNTYLEAGQNIDPVLLYDNQESGNGNPSIANHSISPGQAIFSITNTLDGNDTGSPLIIQFKIQ